MISLSLLEGKREYRNDNSALVWSGPSLLDGKPIALIVSGIKRSKNLKTGNLVQTYIIRRDISPVDAVRTGEDVSFCGDCPHRGGSCYVIWGQAPNNLFHYTFENPTIMVRTVEEVQEMVGEKMWRLGSAGDPVAVPLKVYKRMNLDRRCGYTHQWRKRRFQPWRRYIMASVDSPEEFHIARAMGWRTFRTRLPEEPLLKGEFACPASEEEGYWKTCDQCGACNGTNGNPTRWCPSIIVHGSRVGGKREKYRKWRGK